MSSRPVANVAPDSWGFGAHASRTRSRSPRRRWMLASLPGGSAPAGDADLTMTETEEEEGTPAVAGNAAVAADVVLKGRDADAEPNKAKGHYVSKTLAVGSRSNHNGSAHFDEEMQNGLANVHRGARYFLPPIDNGRFGVSDLVWGKVKGHPWWPGEIFDPLDASELALKYKKKGYRLVAYFGDDNTFSWCDESQLKPFVPNYSQHEKQTDSDAFVGAVNYALEELSRRVLLGTSCQCFPKELYDNAMSYVVDNAGLKDGVLCSQVDRSKILACFRPENLLQYVKSLAVSPGQGGDLLELVVACSQLTSFYLSKGCPEFASFQNLEWMD